jgi:sigma-E factor negative regulatory protein RseC
MMQEMSATDNCESDVFSHQGTISNLDSKSYYISIISKSACSSCHSKSICTVIEMQEKIVEVPRNPGESFQLGDTVQVQMNKSTGIKAVFLGYLIPFTLLILLLILSNEFFQSEGLAGIIAIGTVGIYYLVLYQFKERFKKTFRFSIHH